MLFGLLLLLLTTVEVIAQDYIAIAKPKGAKKWGYIDEKGKMLTNAAFKRCYPFSADGFGVIEVGGKHKYFFINTKGEKLKTEISFSKIIESGAGDFKFGVAGFNEGLAPVKDLRGWGFIDTGGKLAIMVKYDHVSPFKEGHTWAEKANQFFVLDKEGNETPVKAAVYSMKSFVEGLAPFKSNSDLKGYIGLDGKVAIKAQFISVGYFKDGMAYAKTEDRKTGYINKEGNWLIKPEFVRIGPFFNGRARAKKGEDDLYGYLDKEGGWAIKPICQGAKKFDEVSGLASVKIDDRWQYINKDGKELVIKADTDVFKDFINGYALGRKDDKWGFINKEGEWAVQPEFDALKPFFNGFAIARKGKLWGFIGVDGNWLVKPEFEGVKRMMKIGK